MEYALNDRLAPEMRVVNAVPSSTPDPQAAWPEFKEIKVTTVAENTSEADAEIRGPPDLGERYTIRPWKLVCVTANSRSYQIISELGLTTAGESNDGRFYELVVGESCLSWLSFHGLELNLDYNPTKPIESDISIHGTWRANRRAQDFFLDRALKAVRSRQSYELQDQARETCYRDVARSNGLMVPLERAILDHDISKSDCQVRRRLAQCLVFLGLNLLEKCDSPLALDLLAKDHDDLLQPFRKDHMDLCEAALENEVPIKTLERSKLQTISLVRGLLEFSGGRVDCRQHAFDPEYTASDNLSQCGILIGITGINRFGNFDSEKMYNALLKSKVFAEDPDTSALDTVTWSIHMMNFLPIGFPKRYLKLPSQVLNGLGSGQVDLIRIHLEQIYHQRSSLRKPENNVLLHLTWSSIAHGQPLRVLSEWASSGDGLELHQQMIKDLQTSQKPDQLALTLAALLCHARLLPYTSNDTAQPIKGCYLADLDALLNGHSLSNRRMVFERMGSALLHILYTFGDEYRDMIQLLAIVLGNKAPISESFDGSTKQYFTGRIVDRLTHNSAFKAVGFLLLTEPMPELSMDGEEWIMVPSQSCDKLA